MPELTTEVNLSLLIKLLKMTTSSSDSEALVAMRKANEALGRVGGDWETLLRGKVTIIADPWAASPPRPSAAPPASPWKPSPMRAAPSAPPPPKPAPRPYTPPTPPPIWPKTPIRAPRVARGQKVRWSDVSATTDQL
jgi:hypothetical protein